MALPPLLAATRLKARMFLEFVEQRYGGSILSRPVVEHYNRLRELALEVDPKMGALLPPALPTAGDDFEALDYHQLLFFSKQIVSFLE